MNSTNSNQLDERKKIHIFDTTLRDGEQSPGCTLYPDEKVKFAIELEKLGVDVIEAGFAASRQTDREVIKRICREVHSPYICSLARCVKSDINFAFEALKDYTRRRLHIFMPTSRVQVYEKMGKTYEEIRREITEAVKYGRDFFDNIEFSCEDATRSEVKLIEEIYEEVIGLGVTVANIPDTVGASYPENFGRLVKRITAIVKGKNPLARTSVHCHDDLGTATINSIYGIKNGAEQVECTIGGIGERAGNCSLEQIVAHQKYTSEFHTNISAERIWQLANLLFEFTGVRSDFAPITGKYSFSHKAGIHQHGVAKQRSCYEIFEPSDFGRETELVIGPHSGWHGVMAQAKKIGVEISKEHAERVLTVVANLVRAGIQKEFTDKDIQKFINETN